MGVFCFKNVIIIIIIISGGLCEDQEKRQKINIIQNITVEVPQSKDDT
jgi:hypothetical protein